METFVNDTIKLTVDTDIDVSGYATLVIKYRKPDGTLGRWLASVCPDDVNCLTYTTLIGDLDISGDWLAQGYAEDANEQLNGRWVKFTVHAPLLATCPPWYLKFFAQTGTFTPGNTIYQTVDEVTAFATIDAVDMLGSNHGILTLSGISGTFQDNEIIYESALGSDLLSGWDFTSGWNPGICTINDSDTFTSSSTSGIYEISGSIIADIYYQATFTGSTSSTKVQMLPYLSGQGSFVCDSGETVRFVLAINDKIYIRNINAGVSDITALSLKQITNAALANGVVY